MKIEIPNIAPSDSEILELLQKHAVPMNTAVACEMLTLCLWEILRLRAQLREQAGQ